MSSVTRTSPNEWWVGIVNGLASYIDSAAIVGFGIALVIYQHVFGLTDGQVGWVSGGLTAGIAIGAVVGGRLGDRFGRRTVFIVTMAAITIGAGTMIFASTFPVILTATILVGLGTGADLPVSLATISETASDKNRGKILGFTQILWLVGILVTILTATFVGDLGHLGGQILYGHVAVVALITLGLRLTIPESQTWLTARQSGNTGSSARGKLGTLFRSPYLVPFVALIAFYSLVNLNANTSGQYATFLLVNVAGLDVSTASLLNLIGVPVGIWPDSGLCE